jgi:hypothetical protein
MSFLALPLLAAVECFPSSSFAWQCFAQCGFPIVGWPHASAYPCLHIVPIVVILAVTAWRAYLLSLCSSLLFPLVVLSFWQWCLIAITFRLMVVPPLSSK